MNRIQIVDQIRFHAGRIQSSIFNKNSIALYLCNTDLQDIALFHLRQIGGFLSEQEDIGQYLAVSEEELRWLRSFYRMTVVELDDVDHTALWKHMYAVIPFLA